MLEQIMLQILITILGSTGFGALILWFTKGWIQNYLKISGQNAINEYKQLLDTYTEGVKHELQREMVKVEAQAKNKFTIYPELYQKIVQADGLISSLYGAHWSTNKEVFNENDIKSILLEKNIAEGEIDKIIKFWEVDKEKGLQQLDFMLREISFQTARNSKQDAMNFMLLNELFLSEKIAESAYNILKHFGTMWANAFTGHQCKMQGTSYDISKYYEMRDEIPELIKNIKTIMQEELRPSIKNLKKA